MVILWSPFIIKGEIVSIMGSSEVSVCGLVVMIGRCQRLDPGSIPGRRRFFSTEIFLHTFAKN